MMIQNTKVCFMVLLAMTFFNVVQGQSTSSPVNTEPVRNGTLVTAETDEEERYKIGFNDTLSIKIYRHPDLAQTVNVNTNGTINLFRITEPILAVCKTERELAADIAEAYRREGHMRNPDVNVIATEQRSQAFMVIGAVEKPGNYFINRRVRLLELIAYAGGPNDKAGTRLIVARTGSTSNCRMAEETSPFNTSAVNQENDDFTHLDFRLKDVVEAKQNLVMQPGDVVYMLEADSIYVYGNVNKQGKLLMNTPMTLTQAIATSEGLKPATKKGNVRVLRQIDGGRDREELVFDLREIDRGKVQDPFLEPNDIVAVSEDRVKSILNGIRNSLTQGSSMLFYRVP